MASLSVQPISNKSTITEALQEIKTITRRLESKRSNILPYLARDARVKDPLEREGGSIEFVKRERQAIHDLEERIVTIRAAIQAANGKISLTLNDTTRTLMDWLNWRREIAPGHKLFLAGMVNGIRNIRNEVQKKGQKMVSDEANASVGDVVVQANEKELLEYQEAIEKLLGDLDGKLSLLNATTVIEI